MIRRPLPASGSLHPTPCSTSPPGMFRMTSRVRSAAVRVEVSIASLSGASTSCFHRAISVFTLEVTYGRKESYRAGSDRDAGPIVGWHMPWEGHAGSHARRDRNLLGSDAAPQPVETVATGSPALLSARQHRDGRRSEARAGRDGCHDRQGLYLATSLDSACSARSRNRT